MFKSLIAGAMFILIAVVPAWGGGFQDPTGGEDSNITNGEAGKGYVGPLFLEFRDIPNGPGQSSLPSSRQLVISARLTGENLSATGVELQIFSANFTCDDPLPPASADLCVQKEVCTLSKNGRESCETESLVDFQAPASSYAALVASLLQPQMILGYALPPSTVISIDKIVEFVQGGLNIDASGVRSGYAGMDILVNTVD